MWTRHSAEDCYGGCGLEDLGQASFDDQINVVSKPAPHQQADMNFWGGDLP
jgi:hypothetical protein